MYSRATLLLLRWLRVPPEPQPPHGDPASLRVFRAGKNFLNLRLLKWGVAQAGALAGIIFWLGVFSDLGDRVEDKRQQNAQAKTTAPAPAPEKQNMEQAVNSVVHGLKDEATAAGKEFQEIRKNKRKVGPLQGFYAWRNGMIGFLSRLPSGAMLVIWFFELSGIVFYVLQLPVTFLLARMDYDLRWYMVTDRSLRIRHGVWKINESTMSFANIQQVIVSQGPLQRVLGLSDVKVQSAGGGGGDSDEHHGKGDDMHLGLFHSVTNPDEIRDLILARLRHFRESGLGDPEEKSSPVAAATTASLAGSDDLLAAARELAAEARALRATLG
ncbi:Bacterial membrane flanked domain protein [Lacunisphaera limnophila]|uniref:Bacterial membrane flanked domain protein n=1 Tax=Lacunisphaera limnophila TaxID=1838286 RepID=A0A1D8AWE3_9BACT|nr:PH domain-containing protein [Lacunisphaera limnophila]AOS45210.1 Bacterial membrane flanked domain protein [Lacunisphaera limnophila]